MAGITENDIKNMSPEQIAELQKQNCIFCHIISDRVSSKKIYEDDKTLAVLDINPANPGHILLMPKEHHMIMPQMPDDLIMHMGMLSKQLSHAVLKALQVEGTNIFIANGAIAGQKSPHFMIHIIPRKENDGLSFDLPENKIDDSQLKQLQAILQKRLSDSLSDSLSLKDKQSAFISKELAKNSKTCSVCAEIGSFRHDIFSDEEISAFLSTTPSSAGHVIVAPLAHSPILENVPDFVVGKMFLVANKISVAAFESFGAQGTNMIINNGIPAGQKLPHCTLHMIPRKQGDNLNFTWTPRQLNEEEMSTIELKIKEHTKNIGYFEKKKEPPIDLDSEESAPEQEMQESGKSREHNYMLQHIRRMP